MIGNFFMRDLTAHPIHDARLREPSSNCFGNGAHLTRPLR
jgi:hypothetical protein